MSGLEYNTIYCSESLSTNGWFGIKIMVAATSLPDLKDESIKSAVYKAAELVSTEVQGAIVALSEKAQERAKKYREEITGLFPERIFVETIPNGYCSDWCCRHLPWFVITTEVGKFKIGWRKRVINIDWTEVVGAKTSKELFQAENVTKGNYYIHAWDLADAKRYVDTILASAKKV